MPPFFIWAPAAAIGLLMLLPPAYLLVRAMESGQGALDVLLSLRTLAILGRTTLLMAVVTAGCVVLGVSLAWLTLRADLPLRRAFSTLLTLPLVMPSYVFALIVVTALGPKGIAQGWLEPFGVDRLPSVYGLPGAALGLALISFPYVMLPAQAALRRMDPSVEEAARNLGRSPLGVLFAVTLPLLRPAIVAGALLVALYTLSDFGMVSLLRYQTFTWVVFIQYETAFDRGVAAALALAPIALALLILAVESRTRGSAAYHRATPGAQRQPALASLGRWRWPAAAYAGAVVAASLALPVALLLYWVVRGVSAGEPLDLLWSNTLNTVYVSAVAAAAAAVFGAPVAVLSVRYPGWASSALERLTYVGFAGLPDNVHARRRVRRPVHSGGGGFDSGRAAAGEPADGGGGPEPGQDAVPRLQARDPAAADAGHCGGHRARLPAHDEGAARDADPEPDRIPHACDVGLELRVRGVLRARGDAVARAHPRRRRTDGVPRVPRARRAVMAVSRLSPCRAMWQERL